MNKKVTVQNILDQLNLLAAPESAEEWDAVGLQIGDPRQEVERVLLCLDAERRAIKTAVRHNCQLLISHHPLIFQPLPSLRVDQPGQKNVIELAKSGISLIAAHTNLDAAKGGVSDSLTEFLLQAMKLEVGARKHLGPYCRQVETAEKKLLSYWLKQVRLQLGSAGCRINTDIDRPVSRVAFWPGALAEEIIEPAVDAGTELIICGEIKHHLGLALAEWDIAVIDTGHDVSERVVLEPLARQLRKMLPQIEFAVQQGMDYNKIAY